MNETKQVTPDMIDGELSYRIADAQMVNQGDVRKVLAWLANHPIEPTEEQQAYLHKKSEFSGKWNSEIFPVEWMRIAFLKKDPELPEEVKNLLWEKNPFPGIGAGQRHDKAVIEAYRIGKEPK